MTNDSVLIGGWPEFVVNNYFVQSGVGKIFFSIVPVLFPYLFLAIVRRKFPFIFHCTEKTIVCNETIFNLENINKFLIR